MKVLKHLNILAIIDNLNYIDFLELNIIEKIVLAKTLSWRRKRIYSWKWKTYIQSKRR